MSDLANAILEHLRTQTTYKFSSESVQRAEENKTIDYLVENGYIVIKMRTIGYVIASVI